MEHHWSAGDQLPITHTATGTPVGVQLVAAHGRDDLALAGQLEAAADWRTRAPDSTETRPGR